MEPQRELKRLERVWNSKSVAVAMLLAFFLLSLWSIHSVHSAGTAIAVLGGVAAVMTTRTEMKFLEKAGYIVVITILVIAELKAIQKSDEDVRQEREEQLHQFTELRNETLEGIDNLMGSDSYLMIVPHGQLKSLKDSDGKFLLIASVIGKHTVWDSHVEMGKGPVDIEFYTKPHQNFELKPIAPSHIAGLGITVQPSDMTVTTFGFTTSTRSTFAIENLQIRFNRKEQCWEFQYWIYAEKPVKSPVPPELLKHADWVPIAYPVLVGSGVEPAK